MIVFLIALLGWLIQSIILFNWDVSWLMEASNRLLHGGSYAKDFFENNPPLILYEYFIPNLLRIFFHFNKIIALRIYVFGMAGISLYLSRIFLKSIFPAKDTLLANLSLITLSCLFFILPMDQFGQREHLLFIFSMPYFLMMTLRLQQQPIKSAMAYGVGAFAAFGFLLKPYFLPTLVLVELYYLYAAKEKKLTNFIRPEIISIACLLLLYMAAILIFHRDYLFIVLPYAMRWCRFDNVLPWRIVLFNHFALFCLIPLAAIFFRNNPYKNLFHILIIALVGFLISYYIQRTLSYYHILPAFSLTLLIFMLLLGMLIAKPCALNHVIAMIFGILIFYYPYLILFNTFNSSITEKLSLNKLIEFIDQHGQYQSLYFLSNQIVTAYPVVDYTHDFRVVSRFSFLMGLQGMVKQYDMPFDRLRSPYQTKDKDFLIDMIADDIEQKKPDLIFVDVGENSKQFAELFYIKNDTWQIKSLPFNYLDAFAHNAHFRAAWAHYRYMTTVQQDDFSQPYTYRFEVYQRKT